MPDDLDPNVLNNLNQWEQTQKAAPPPPSASDTQTDLDAWERQRANVQAGKPADTTGRPWWQDVLVGAGLTLARWGTSAAEMDPGRSDVQPLTGPRQTAPVSGPIADFAKQPYQNAAQSGGGFIPDIALAPLAGTSLAERTAVGAATGAMSAPPGIGNRVRGAITGGVAGAAGPLAGSIVHRVPYGIVGVGLLSWPAYFTLHEMGVPQGWIRNIAIAAGLAGSSGQFPAGPIGAMAEQLRTTKPDVYRELMQSGAQLVRQGMQDARQ